MGEGENEVEERGVSDKLSSNEYPLNGHGSNDDHDDDEVHAKDAMHSDGDAASYDHLHDNDRDDDDDEADDQVEDDGEVGNVLLVKGAAEVLVHRCTHYLVDTTADTAEEVRVLTEEVREEVCRSIQRLQRQSLRCLALAYRVDNAPEIDRVCVQCSAVQCLLSLSCYHLSHAQEFVTADILLL